MSYKDVKDFHYKFDLLPKEPGPILLPPDLMSFRLKFKMEEMTELTEAYNQQDLVKVADALIDLVYVAMGTAVMMNLPWHELWAEVHAANMRKVRAEHRGQSKRGSTYDVVKPHGWQPPNLERILGDRNAD